MKGKTTAKNKSEKAGSVADLDEIKRKTDFNLKKDIKKQRVFSYLILLLSSKICSPCRKDQFDGFLFPLYYLLYFSLRAIQNRTCRCIGPKRKTLFKYVFITEKEKYLFSNKHDFVYLRTQLDVDNSIAPTPPPAFVYLSILIKTALVITPFKNHFAFACFCTEP